MARRGGKGTDKRAWSKAGMVGKREGDREGRINERNKKSGKYANDWQGEEDEALAVTVPLLANECVP